MDVSEFVVAALLLELTPGPNMAYLATLSLARGRVSGLAATAGVAFGLSVHAILAALGAGVLIQQFALLYDILRWLGVGYLLFLAWEGWQTQAESSPGRADLRSTVSPLFLGVSCQMFSIPNRSSSLYPWCLGSYKLSRALCRYRYKWSCWEAFMSA